MTKHRNSVSETPLRPQWATPVDPSPVGPYRIPTKITQWYSDGVLVIEQQFNVGAPKLLHIGWA